MACELFASKHRTFAGIIIEDFWGVATCTLALMAYLVRHWVYLQLAISLFGVLTIPLFWYAASQGHFSLCLCFLNHPIYECIILYALYIFSICSLLGYTNLTLRCNRPN